MSDDLDAFLRWVGNDPGVVWFCPQCHGVEAVTEENENEPPECMHCGASPQRALAEKVAEGEA